MSPQNNNFSLIFFINSSNGKCVPYYKRDSVVAICDDFFKPDIDYVYIPKRRFHGSQYLLRQFTEKAVRFLATIPEYCKDMIIGVMCTHYYLSCGSNGTLHVPLPICPDACLYVSETECPNVWRIIVNFVVTEFGPAYSNDEGVKLPSCNETDYLINYLNLTKDCCSNGGVILPIISTTGNLSINHNSITYLISTVNVPTSTMSTSTLTNNTTTHSILPSSSVTPSTASSIELAVLIPIVVTVFLIFLIIIAVMVPICYIIRKRFQLQRDWLLDIPLTSRPQFCKFYTFRIKHITLHLVYAVEQCISIL